MDNTLDIIAGLRAGDDAAARAVFQRYANRLIAFARSRLSGRFSRRFDPEDIVQSACGSFFAGTRENRLNINSSNDLWSLLVAITMNKLLKKIEYHTAAKRKVDRDQSFDGRSSQDPSRREAVAGDPSPSEQAALWDEIELLTRDLTDVQREIVQFRLQGWQIEEIAEKVGRSERTVRRVLDLMKDALRQRIGGGEW